MQVVLVLMLVLVGVSVGVIIGVVIGIVDNIFRCEEDKIEKWREKVQKYLYEWIFS